jgi:hypothetical protein
MGSTSCEQEHFILEKRRTGQLQGQKELRNVERRRKEMCESKKRER